MKPFVKRQFLNGEKSPSTGIVYAYHGVAPWDKKRTTKFFEIADCHQSARLHQSDIDTDDDFIEKLEKIQKTLNKFIHHLKKSKKR